MDTFVPIIDTFCNNSEMDVLLSSEVGSEGLDLQAASVVVNYDLPWNPMVVEQRIGRLDRIGQASDTIVILNLVAAGTIADLRRDAAGGGSLEEAFFALTTVDGTSPS